VSHVANKCRYSSFLELPFPFDSTRLTKFLSFYTRHCEYVYLTVSSTNIKKNRASYSVLWFRSSSPLYLANIFFANFTKTNPFITGQIFKYYHEARTIYTVQGRVNAPVWRAHGLKASPKDWERVAQCVLRHSSFLPPPPAAAAACFGGCSSLSPLLLRDGNLGIVI
jgi:hypothetical protein